jgi:hypothetical protein
MIHSILFSLYGNCRDKIRALAPSKEEISAVWRGRGEKFVSDNSKCIGTSKESTLQRGWG